VLAIWREVFGLPDLGCDDDFFVLGGHSVLAMQIASRVMDAFGVELSMEAWQSQATVRSLARRIDAASHGAGSPGSP
jgi:acyl carrier protein